MPHTTRVRSTRSWLVALGVIGVLGAITIACADDTRSSTSAESSPVPSTIRPSQADNSFVVIARSEKPVGETDQSASPDELTVRELEAWLIVEPAGGPKVTPAAWDPVYEGQVEASYRDHLVMDLIESGHLCRQWPDNHCLVAVVTYRPCQSQAVCDNHSVLGITMLKAYDDWTGVLIDNFDPTVDLSTMATDAAEAIVIHEEVVGHGFGEIHWRVNADRPESSRSRHRALEAALTRYTELLPDPSSSDVPSGAINADGVGQALIDIVLDIYDTTIEEISVPIMGPIAA